MKSRLTVQIRTILAVVYIILLVVFAKVFFDFSSPLPSLNSDGLWFWAVLATLVFTRLIDQPFYTPPANALLNALAVLIAIYQIFFGDAVQLEPTIKVSWQVLAIITCAILALTVISMFLGWFENFRIRQFSKLLARLSSFFGSPHVVFGGLYLLILYTFHFNNSLELFALFTVWIIFVWQPLERIVPYFNEFLVALQLNQKTIWIGTVVSYRQPRIIYFDVKRDANPKEGSMIAVVTDREHFKIAIVIDSYQLTSSRWARSIILQNCEHLHKANLSHWGEIGSVLSCSSDMLSEKASLLASTNNIYERSDKFVGFVVEDSNVNAIRVEIVAEDPSVTEGSLFSIDMQGHKVLYQVIDGITDSQGLIQSNRYGFIQAVARKIGEWDFNQKVLNQVPWTPAMYSPVYHLNSVESETNSEYVGYIPRTNYGIGVNCNELVTHNTAILGVLGTGKTYLALELIERMLGDGVKVWVIDITNQYQQELTPHIRAERQNSGDEIINSEIKPLARNYDENKNYGGNHLRFRTKLKEHIREFLTDEDWMLRVFDPNNYTVTEQTGWKDRETGKAGFGMYSPAQITTVVTETILELLQDEITPKARLCLVFEEAHTLVPEWNATAHEGDVGATNATAKAILQGRKYGFGCLLITQRTAHVTKSILNQCHTVFALQTFDKTGMDFLSNYLGDDYTKLLSVLEPRHCVAYGRALNSQTPLIIKLNYRKNITMPSTEETAQSSF